MPPSDFTCGLPSDAPTSVIREDGIEPGFISKSQPLKCAPNGANRSAAEISGANQIAAWMFLWISTQQFTFLHCYIMMALVDALEQLAASRATAANLVAELTNP
jgi:hypothetical protein